MDDPSNASSLLAGRYRLGILLGHGPSTDVHAAVDERTHAPVAVKLFRAPLLHGHEGDVHDEGVRALVGLRHPGLVELLEVGEVRGRPYVVMSRVDAPTLAERLVQGPLPPDEAARVGADLAAALAYVHGRGVVHRDVTPANVFVASDGRARLADVGIARLVDATRVTRSGAVGTAGSLAPEQVTDGRVGPAADLYALGLLLLACVTGRREDDGPVLRAALARLHRPPEVPSHLPAGWAALLGALLAVDPLRRPSAEVAASAAGVLAERPDAAVDALRLSVGLPHAPVRQAPVGSGVTAPGPLVGARRRRRAALVGLAAALALLGGAAAVAQGVLPTRSTVGATAVPASFPSATAAPVAAPVAADPLDAALTMTAQADAAAALAATGRSQTSPEQALADAVAALQPRSVGDAPTGGAAAPLVRRGLDEVSRSEGSLRANRAVLLAEDVRLAVEGGLLDADLGRQVTAALDGVAAPADLLGLVGLVQHDAAALGPVGPELGQGLAELDHLTPAQDVARRAGQLLALVRDGVAAGRLVPAVGRVAAPVLDPLSRTQPLAALQQLVVELGSAPPAGAPAAEVLEQLRGLARGNVYQRTLDSRALLLRLQDPAAGAELPPTFRARVVPVLEPLTQPRSG